ncbi:MAG: hypothetical protein R3E84_18980 [Pseudomonadales bacterium]
MPEVVAKRLAPLASSLLLILCQGDANAESSISSDAAGAVVSAYVQALQSGDTETLMQLAGGELLARRSTLWRRPGYSQILAATYAADIPQIERVASLAGEEVSVDVRLVMDGEGVSKRYIVAELPSGLRVVDERLVAAGD